jgi:integrase/recombinase XerD
LGIGKQAKTLNEHQLRALLHWLDTRKNADRNRLIVLLSFKAGLRAKEIASLKWSMVMNADGEIGDYIQLTNEASKGKGGRVIALNHRLKKQLLAVKELEGVGKANSVEFVIRARRQEGTTAQVIVNVFGEWYRKLGFVGCSSHSGRRSSLLRRRERYLQWVGRCGMFKRWQGTRALQRPAGTSRSIVRLRQNLSISSEQIAPVTAAVSESRVRDGFSDGSEEWPGRNWRSRPRLLHCTPIIQMR